MGVLSPLSLFSVLFTFINLCNTQPTTTNYLKIPLLHTHKLHPSDTHPQFPITSAAYLGTGQYFVNLRIGTPPRTLRLVADTGSDLVWVICSACHNCANYPTDSVLLVRHSSTFSPYHCFDSACRLVPHPNHTPCNHTQLSSPCRYEYSYGDGSITRGFFSTETATFYADAAGVVTRMNLAFGCSFNLSGPSVTGSSFNGAGGVMALGRGSISFISQLGARFGNKFSYCLMDYNLDPTPTSYLVIGDTQNNPTVRLSYTPIKTNAWITTFYYINIKSVYINHVELDIRPSVWELDEFGNGGTIVDSGTTLTFLVESAYRPILAAFEERVVLPRPAQMTPGFDLCINVSGVETLKLPRLSFRLEGDVLFSPPVGNYFIDTAENVKCLALRRVVSPSGYSVIGNVMQQGFLFEFDMDKSRLGFSQHGCAVS